MKPEITHIYIYIHLLRYWIAVRPNSFVLGCLGGINICRGNICVCVCVYNREQGKPNVNEPYRRGVFDEFKRWCFLIYVYVSSRENDLKICYRKKRL